MGPLGDNDLQSVAVAGQNHHRDDGEHGDSDKIAVVALGALRIIEGEAVTVGPARQWHKSRRYEKRRHAEQLKENSRPHERPLNLDSGVSPLKVNDLIGRFRNFVAQHLGIPVDPLYKREVELGGGKLVALAVVSLHHGASNCLGQPFGQRAA